MPSHKPMIIRGKAAPFPLICAPLVGATREAVLLEAAAARAARADIVEWRVDHFQAIERMSAVIERRYRMSNAWAIQRKAFRTGS